MLMYRKAILCGILAVTGCGGSSDNGDDVAGPCVHNYREPVVHIESAVGGAAGDSLPHVYLDELTVDGEPVVIDSLLRSVSSNVEEQDDGKLLCTVPCAFGTQEGAWEFVASAPNYEPTAQRVEAQYEEFSGGCPSYSDGGTRTTITLTANNLAAAPG